MLVRCSTSIKINDDLPSRIEPSLRDVPARDDSAGLTAAVRFPCQNTTVNCRLLFASRVAQCAALAIEKAPAGDCGKRGGACRRPRPCPQWTLRPPMPVLPLSSDARRATRRGFGWPPGSSDAYSELLQRQRFNRALAAQLIRALAAQLYGRRPDRFCAAATSVPSSGSSADALLLALENAERSTSFAKKFFPSIGTIMICSLSESLSAIIFWISIGFDFSTAASNFMRSASAAAVTRIRFASAADRFFCRSNSALLSMIFACAAASAFCSVAS